MKKLLTILMLLICTVASACTKNLDNIPSLELIRQYGNEWSLEKLKGYTPDQLQEVWGEYDGMLSGMYGYIWEIDGDRDYVIIYFDGNSNTVSGVINQSVMKAEITEVNENSILVKPDENEWELKSSDIISVSTAEIPEETRARLEVGKTVIVRYNGVLAESYPAQITKPYEITFEAAIPSDLTDEEKAVLDSMPEIVTIRTNHDQNANTTEFLYIKKNGEARSFICNDIYEYEFWDIEWVKEQLDNNEGEVIDAVNIHKLIDFYNTFLLLDEKEKMTTLTVLQHAAIPSNYYHYNIYTSNPESEIVEIAYGYNSHESFLNDPNGFEAYKSYIELDPFRIVYTVVEQ